MKTKTIAGAIVTTEEIGCGCVAWRQSLHGHEDAVRYYPCSQHEAEK